MASRPLKAILTFGSVPRSLTGWKTSRLQGAQRGYKRRFGAWPHEHILELEARGGIEPPHKGFAVLTSTRNPLIKQGVSVGFWLPKGVF